MQTFLIRNAVILTQNDERLLLPGSLSVREGRIAEVGEEVSAVDGPVYDLQGDYLIPGLIQAHIHLCQTLFRHQAEGLPLLRWLQERIWPLEAALDEEALRISAELGIAELLLSGTTCLLDMGTVHHQDVICEAVQANGIRAALGKAMMDSGQGVPTGLMETTRQSLDESMRLAKRWDGAESGRIRYAFAPRFVLSCSADLQREVGRLSRQHGYLIHTHSSEHPLEIEIIQQQMGGRNVEVLHQLGMCSRRSVFAHGVHLDETERTLLADSRTCICHCPSSNLKLGSGVADLPALFEAGINVGIGADGAACNNHLDGFTEMRLAHLLQNLKHGPGAVSAQSVLDLATRNGALALGWQDRVGSLEPGKEADMVRLDRNDFRLGLGSDPLTEIVTAARRGMVRDVWVAGHHLVRQGELVRIDRARLLQQGKSALAKTLRRAGLAG